MILTTNSPIDERIGWFTRAAFEVAVAVAALLLVLLLLVAVIDSGFDKRSGH